MSKNSLRTYIVELSCSDWRDNYSIKIRARSYQEAVDRAYRTERYPIRSCTLARWTKNDQRKANSRNRFEKKLERLRKFKNQIYYQLCKAQKTSKKTSVLEKRLAEACLKIKDHLNKRPPMNTHF